jgi:ribosomal protein S18 acetylase RimI-like enzyme
LATRVGWRIGAGHERLSQEPGEQQGRAPADAHARRPAALDSFIAGEIRKLEELAANAWPAAVVQAVDGWRLRFNHGVTRRANSVWPNAWSGSLALDERLALVEDFYARRGVVARFQLTPVAEPSGVDALLARRGYALEESVHVQIAETRDVLERTRQSCEVAIAAGPSDSWTHTAWPESELDPAVRRATVERIGPETACAIALTAGEPAGVALGVSERGFVGLFCFHTLPGFRRSGVARSLLHALAGWAHSRSAASLYLQVHNSNAPARALYARAGFETLYRYHYRTQAF